MPGSKVGRTFKVHTEQRNSAIFDHDAQTVSFTVKSKMGEFRVLIDLEDWNRVSSLHWCMSSCFKKGLVYFRAHHKGGEKRTSVTLHRFIMRAAKGMLVDHREPSNTLDNRKSNLRFATHTH